MMTIAKRPPLYFTLEVSKEAFDEVKQRLVDNQLDWKYVSEDTEGREVIVFGSTALRAKDESNNSRE